MSDRPKCNIRAPPREPVLVAQHAAKSAERSPSAEVEVTAQDDTSDVYDPVHDTEAQYEQFKRLRMLDDDDAEYAELVAFEAVMESMATPSSAGALSSPAPPAKKNRRRRKKSSSPPPAVSSAAEESTEIDTPKAKRKKPKRKKRAAGVESSDSDDLVVENISLVVPCVDKQASVGLVKLRLGVDTSFEDALDEIHSTISCTGENIKPALTCRIGKMKAKESGYKLSNTREWENLVQDAVALHRSACAPNTRAARDAALQLPTLTILVPEPYIAALKLRRTKGNSNKKKPSVIDLDGDEGDVVGGGNRWGLSVSETEVSQQLYAARKCVRCKSGFCLPHKSITAGQFSTWTSALVNKLPGVTFSTPPKTIEFAEFWPGERMARKSQIRGRSASPGPSRRRRHSPSPSSSPPHRRHQGRSSLQHSGYPSMPPIPFYPYPMPPLPLPMSSAREPSPGVIPSSDGPLETAIFTDPRHPILAEFFAALAVQPHLAHHDLPACVQPLTSNGFYTTESLKAYCVKGGAKELVGIVPELKRGTAEVILKAVRGHYKNRRRV